MNMPYYHRQADGKATPQQVPAGGPSTATETPPPEPAPPPHPDTPATATPPAAASSPPTPPDTVLPPAITDQEMSAAFAREFGHKLDPDDPVSPFLRAVETIFGRYIIALDRTLENRDAEIRRLRTTEKLLSWLLTLSILLHGTGLAALYYLFWPR